VSCPAKAGHSVSDRAPGTRGGSSRQCDQRTRRLRPRPPPFGRGEGKRALARPKPMDTKACSLGALVALRSPVWWWLAGGTEVRTQFAAIPGLGPAAPQIAGHPARQPPKRKSVAALRGPRSRPDPASGRIQGFALNTRARCAGSLLTTAYPPMLGATSRMNRDVRLCERLRAKLPGPARQLRKSRRLLCATEIDVRLTSRAANVTCRSPVNYRQR
jgi:hypothetical protein